LSDFVTHICKLAVIIPHKTKKMKTKLNLNLFTANYFILSLVILLLNDFYLKYEFSNFITGKLSDFACLFIFPYFISVFSPNKSRGIYIFTFAFFIFWKLEISEQFIKFISNITNFAFYRTVDISDLIALSILPFSYNYFQKKNTEVSNYKTSNFALNSLIGVIAIYSFLADTNPEQVVKVNIKSKKEFKLQMDKKQILDNLVLMNNRIKISETDSLFNICFHITEYRAESTARVRIVKVDKENTVIKIDSITEVLVVGRGIFGISQSNIDSCKKINPAEYENFFKENCIDIITGIRETEYPTYYAYKTE